MGSMEDLEQRVAAVEAELKVVRQAAAARALAAGGDHDVAEYRAELRGHTRVLGALRETQLEQGQAIAKQGQAIAEQGQAIGRLDDRVDQLTGAVAHIRDQHGASLQQIVGLLNHLIDRDSSQE